MKRKDILYIPVRNPDDDRSAGRCIRVSDKAAALVDALCMNTNRTRQDVASRLIEWAFDRTEIQTESEEADEVC